MIQGVLVVLAFFYGEAIFTLIAPENTESSMLIMGGIILLFLMIGETINGGFGLADLPIIYRSPLFNPFISVLMIPAYIVLVILFTQHFSYGPAGVAMALCSTYFLMNLIRVLIIRKLYQINMLNLKIFKVIFAGLASGIAFQLAVQFMPIDLIHGWGSALGIPLLFILYGLSILFIAMEKKDIEKLKARLS